MATSNPCCNIAFTCVQCPIITGPDCVPPNNMMPGQLWYNPCTCTYYFECGTGFDEDNNCETLTPLNFKPGAGIQYSGDCENGHFISVKIEPGVGLGFTGDGELTINCADLIDHCNLMHWDDPMLCDKLQEACDFHPNITSCPGSIIVTPGEDGAINLCIDTQTYYRNAGGSSGAGMCIGVQAGTFPDGRAIFQSRDASFLVGSGSVSGGGSLAGYFTETFTNPWNQPAVIDVTMVAQPNVIAAASNDRPLGAGDFLPNKKMTYIHSITEQLNVSPPAFGLHDSPVPENWCYTQLDTTSQFHQLSAIPVGSGEWTQPRSSQGTNSARFVKILLPGQSITLYYQWWAVFNQSQDAGVYEWILHGGLSTSSLLHKHAAPF